MNVVENNQNTIITNKCMKISKPFIRACQKHGCGVELLEIVTKTPISDYEMLYNQSEITYSDTVYALHGILTTNPPEDFYKDQHLETKGDATLLLINYMLQEVGFIKDGTLTEYQNIPKKIMGYHVRIGSDIYRIDEARTNDIYQGFPITCLLGLTFIKSISLETNEEDNES